MRKAPLIVPLAILVCLESLFKMRVKLGPGL